MSIPILYSFRRCPYAMRARMAIMASGTAVELREVQLSNKPVQMLEASTKATVPLLVLEDKTVIDESLDIMRWALKQYDPHHWLSAFSEDEKEKMDFLITENDTSFKHHLDHYKYADRFPAYPVEHYRAQGEVFLQKLDDRLQQNRYLFAETISFADIAIFPFIRQFAYVDIDWFEQQQFVKLNQWLNRFIDSENFKLTMQKYPVWFVGAPAIFWN